MRSLPPHPYNCTQVGGLPYEKKKKMLQATITVLKKPKREGATRRTSSII